LIQLAIDHPIGFYTFCAAVSPVLPVKGFRTVQNMIRDSAGTPESVSYRRHGLLTLAQPETVSRERIE